jgi:NitT/TauT family transport system ATP-binding protein
MTSVLDRPLDVGQRTAVQLDGVGKAFGRGPDAVTALAGVDLRVRAGEFVVLLGASGCGKTTLLNLVAGLDQPSSGTVDVRSGRPAVVFQEPALLPWLDAGRNVELPLRLSGVGRSARRARAGELLDLVRLGGQARKRPHELSGGMRQRVALARALAATGDGDDGGGLLLMDEPFAALDAMTRESMMVELQRIWATTGKSVLFITHSIPEAVFLSDRVVVLSPRPGRVLQTLEIDLPRPRTLQTMASPRFAELSNQLREVFARMDLG